MVVSGLVIRAVDYKDADRILTVLTGERGKITVGASGARRKNSRLLGASQLFAYSEMTLSEKSGRLYLQSADLLEQFRGLSRDIESLALASYFAEMLSVEAEESQPPPDLLRLCLNSLHALCAGGFEPLAVKAAFELRYAALSGWSPDLAQRDGGFERLDRPALSAARYIISADVSKIFSFKLPRESLEKLALCCEKYAANCLERDFRTLGFYKSITEEMNNYAID